ncbi:alpha-glucuronidase [Sphingobacterium sp. UBA5670]|uniref:alpha-glucuronidase n=1 Tax=Sphingobacterium sp. UBA5670 TaxID=1947502 RepID=UPI0025E619EF|nr:alpha-glucuronidase [Sphingobacterium sp. UBA5670]
MSIFKIIFFGLVLILPLCLKAEDGSKLWLRYNPVSSEDVKSRNIRLISSADEISNVAKEELEAYWGKQSIELKLDKSQKRLKDGFIIQGDASKIQLTAYSSVGLLYGAYRLLELQHLKENLQTLNIVEIPSFDIRTLNHWDNLDGTVERGYAGRSLWQWEDLPGKLSPKYEQYARANASIGINATVLNNVNASSKILASDYILKVKALAKIFRKYGIKVYLTANFASPKTLGGLVDSDPLRKEVKEWWKSKVKEIYTEIPDFGGFLVKANSEGEPGPQDYGRSHADGANMLADVLKPYGGVVMWRAFVYNPKADDRAKQAYDEFLPLDGKFRDNVIIQIKNGPIDFQPREPFSPLFGAMRNTSQMLEFQITQEYLGQSNHLVFLAPLFKETLDSDTYAYGVGTTVAKITSGTFRDNKKSAISAVANIGLDPNWTGHDFAQANWYAFGKLAWNHQLSSKQIAEEWLKLTFSNEVDFVKPITDMMISSRETVVNYMMPLGLHHIFAEIHHYGPAPWYEVPERVDWRSTYYHQADSLGIGFDRTIKGTNAVSQYFPPLDSIYNDVKSCPESYLLWFHHIPWDFKMRNGENFWNSLCYKYYSGVKEVREFQKTWDKIEAYVDPERFRFIQSKLKVQALDAVWWKDACLLYFQTFSKMPIPYELDRPVHNLEDLKNIKLDMKHHN